MVLLGACNPLLDVVAEVPMALLDEYDLPHGGAVLANKKQIQLFSKLEKEYKCKFLPGGCGQNTLRVYQALSKKPGETKFLGCIGKDKEGQQLRDLLNSQGIEPLYKVSESNPTGTCMVLVTEKERCVCTNLGASVEIDLNYLEKIWKHVEESDAVYCTGFLMSSSSAVLLRLARHCVEEGKVFACNLSAVFLMHQFKKEYIEMIECANITCGNKEEALKFAEINGLNCSGSIGDIAVQILDIMLEKEKKQKNNEEKEEKQEKIQHKQYNKPIKVVVITQGADPVVVASRTSCDTISIASYPVPTVASEKVVDLNGAGDAFIGGFLFSMLEKDNENKQNKQNKLENKEKNIENAVKLGNWCAGVVIQQSGFQFSAEGCPYI